MLWNIRLCVIFRYFGNYAVYLQITEQFNVISYLNNYGTEATIIEIMHQLPFSTITIILFLISAFLFLATTFDSGSYILAAASQKSDRENRYVLIVCSGVCVMFTTVLFNASWRRTCIRSIENSIITC